MCKKLKKQIDMWEKLWIKSCENMTWRPFEFGQKVIVREQEIAIGRTTQENGNISREGRMLSQG